MATRKMKSFAAKPQAQLNSGVHDDATSPGTFKREPAECEPTIGRDGRNAQKMISNPGDELMGMKEIKP